MTTRAKAVLIIGLQEQGNNNEIAIAQRFGYQAILFKQEISMQEAMQADVPFEVDLNNEEATIQKALELRERWDIQAVYTLNEYRIPLAAKVKEALGLPHGLSYEAAIRCRNKKLTRQRLADHNLGSARFKLVQTPADALSAMLEIPLPVVIKPSNEAGSNYVTRCDEPADIYDAVDTIRRHTRNWVGQQMDTEILLEEFLEGPEFSVEACTFGRETTVLAITAKRTESAVEVGHTVPAPLAEADAEAMRTLVKQALAALGVNDTVTHTEVKLTPAGPRIIEVNARPGGDRIHQLVLAVTGYELRELSLHLALGGTLDNAPRYEAQAPSAAIRFFEAEQGGRVRLFDPSEADAIPQVQTLSFYVKDGDVVERTNSNYSRLGHIIVHGTAELDADQAADAARDRLKIQVL